MSKLRSSRLEKYELIMGLLSGNRPLISIEKALLYSTSKFSNLIRDIRKLENRRAQEESRCHLNSVMIRDELSTALMPYIRILKKTARPCGRPESDILLTEINHISIRKLDAIKLLKAARAIYETFENMPGKLDKVSHESLSQLKLKTDKYEEIISEIQKQGILCEIQESGFDPLYFKAEKLLDNLEGRIEFLGLEYKELYQNYIAVRRNGGKRSSRYDMKYCI
ncbi:MAG: hypothetical protein ACM3Q2_16105 [Syntrophothermus sp.]